MADVATRQVDGRDVVAELRAIARRAAEPCDAGDSVKAAIGRAARRLGLSYRRARSFWYGQGSPRAAEADRLRAWFDTWCEGEAARLEARAAALRQARTARAARVLFGRSE
jgi:hypothetical protein